MSVSKSLSPLLRLWQWAFGAPPEVWKTTKVEFIRREKTIESDWFGYSYWDVYQVHQVAASGKTRTVEQYVSSSDQSI